MHGTGEEANWGKGKKVYKTCQSHCSQSVCLLAFHIITAVFPVFLLNLFLTICLCNLILYLVCVGVLLGLSASHVGDQCE